MRIFLRWCGRLLIGALVLVILALGGALGAIWWTLPAREGQVALPGLSAPVSVGFDGHGIPRIGAANEADAWTALGWLHARDRMFQMEMMRRGGAGRLAEILGTPALRVDRFMRVLGLARRAEQDLAGLPAEARAALEAYARGVNAWIDARGRFAAPEFLLLGAPEAWRPVDSLMWGKIMGLWLSGNWRSEIERARLANLLPPERLADLWPEDRSAGRPDLPLPGSGAGRAAPAPTRHAAGPRIEGLAALEAALPRFPEDAPLPESASNAWVIGPGRSASGAPLLASDPHLGYQAPILWYLVRVELPGGRVLAGATAPGVPGIVIGRSNALAWGFTTTHSDTQDVFVERLAGPDRYETPEGPQPFTLREETIAVRGGEAVRLRVRETRHGPVVSDLEAPDGQADGTVLAVAMAALAPGDTAAAGLLALNHATSVAEAREAARLITSPAQNLMVADRAGGMALFLTGRTPLRRSGDGTRPVAGWDGRADWTGFIPFDAMPHVENPASGVIANGNNRVVPPDHPAFLGADWFGDWRFRRIGEMIAARPRHDATEVAAMQMDTRSLFARAVLPAFLAGPRPAGAAGAARDLLAAWDGDMAPNRPQPLIFHATLDRFAAAVGRQAGLPADAWRPGPEFLQNLLTEPAVAARWCGEAGCGPVLAAALDRAMAEMTPVWGADPSAWRWSAAHEARFDHPVLRYLPGLGALVRLTIPVGGDGQTVNRAGFTADAEGRFRVVHGAGFRGVFDLADPERSLVSIATGQSGHPMSRHWSDLAPDWQDGRMVALDALARPEARLTLAPAPRR